MARTVCQGVKQGLFNRRGYPDIQWYKDGKPQYYCNGYIDLSTDEIFEVCRNCIDYADRAQEDWEKWIAENVGGGKDEQSITGIV